MTFVNRLMAILPSQGVPLQNDTLFLKQSTAVTTATSPVIIQVGTQTVPLSPTISKGFVRVKCYEFVTTAATVTNIQVTVTDGTSYVLVGHYNPATPAVTSQTAGGTTIASANGSITSGAAILTSVSALFTPAMVGAPVVVPGAGAGGIALYTTILSYQSATQVTLSANAGTTVTTATVKLTGPYFTSGAAGTSGTSFDTVGGIDMLFQFEVDINVNEVDVQVTMGTTSATGVVDVEVAGTT
jgi:hypothetical protein